MQVKTLRADLIVYARRRRILTKLTKQLGLFTQNPAHPSLHTERLEPKHLRLYSFRIDRKFRAIFVMFTRSTAEIIDINCHYR